MKTNIPKCCDEERSSSLQYLAYEKEKSKIFFLISKIYMKKYGIKNVRGGSYVTIKLNKNQIIFIKKEIYMADNRCLKCGRKGH